MRILFTSGICWICFKKQKVSILKKNRHLKKQIIEYKLIMKTLYYVFGLLWVDSVIIGIFKFL